MEPFDTQPEFIEGWKKRRFTYLAPGRERKAPQERDFSKGLVVHWDTLDDEHRAFLLEVNAQADSKLFMGLKAVTENTKWASENRDLPNLSFNLRGMIDSCERFYQSNINLREYDYAKLLNQEDWSKVRATLDDLLTRFTVWYSSGGSKVTRPDGLADYIDGGFKNDKTALTFWDALVLSLDASSPSDALLSADVALSRCWQRAKQDWRDAADITDGNDLRVPTFIVVDEAHNFAPEQTNNPLRRRVTDKLLQIASEGRKYGLYLILATQRPTKLHRELVPECENACVLRLQSKVETDFASKVLGLPPTEADQVPEYTLGQGAFIGRWVGGTIHQNTKIAPARISVGGGGLPKHWQTLPEQTPEPLSGSDFLDFVLQQLNSSAKPLLTASLAQSFLEKFGSSKADNWLGKETFSKYLISLNIADLRLTNAAPGHVYLNSKHDAPVELATEVPDIPEGELEVVQYIRADLNFQITSSEVYGAIFRILSKEIIANQFNLTDTSKNVRDACVTEGFNVGRTLINTIIKGIYLSGHSFEADVDQSPISLAQAYFSSIVFQLEHKGAIIDEAQRSRLENHFCGKVPHDTENA